MLSALAAAKSGATANRVRSSVSSFFSWAMREGLLEANPAAFTDRRPEVSRDRLITSDELQSIWVALRDDAYGDIIRLLVLLGVRREEIGGLKYSEIDFGRALVTLPPARVKNKRERLIVLSAPALAILQNRPRLTWPDGSACDLVFGRAGRGFSHWNGAKTDLDARITAEHGEPLRPWVLHDFRRLMSTTMHDQLQIPPHVVEACLGHHGHQHGVAGVYNRAGYEREMRFALDRWSEFVLAVAEGRKSKIIALTRGGRQ
jgi:integrase